MAKFSVVSYWLSSIACGVCLVLALLMTPGVTLADEPAVPPEVVPAPACANPTSDPCPQQLTTAFCLANVCSNAVNTCNCDFVIEPMFRCFCT